MYGNYNNQVIILDRKKLSEIDIKNLMLSVDQVLCGKNSTRITLNKLYRSALQKKSLVPDDKEKLICNLNNYEITFDDKYTLTNGIQGEIYNFSIWWARW